MKKSFITMLGLIAFAGCTFAEMYQVPGSYKETVTEVTVQEGDNVQQPETVVKEKRKFKLFRRRRKDYNPANTYWNFGRPPFWTGSI